MWKSFALAAAVAVAVVGSVTPASATSTEPSRPAVPRRLLCSPRAPSRRWRDRTG